MCRPRSLALHVFRSATDQTHPGMPPRTLSLFLSLSLSLPLPPSPASGPRVGLLADSSELSHPRSFSLFQPKSSSAPGRRTEMHSTQSHAAMWNARKQHRLPEAAAKLAAHHATSAQAMSARWQTAQALSATNRRERLARRSGWLGSGHVPKRMRRNSGRFGWGWRKGEWLKEGGRAGTRIQARDSALRHDETVGPSL